MCQTKGKDVLKKAGKNLTVNIIRYVLFIALSYILLYPFLYVVINSFKSFSDTFDVTVNWVPKSFNLENFALAFKVFEVPKSFLNTIVYEIISALMQFCSCMVAAYGLSRYKLKGKSIMMALLILNILVPSMMIITPSYVNFSQMDLFGILGLISKVVGTEIRPNLIGTPLVLYLPSILAVGLKGGLFIYIFMQFFKGLPKELEEAAWIDGAGPWKTFLRIVVPSSGAAAITVLLFSIVWHWNDYYLAQMYMEDKTLATALNSYSGTLAISKLQLDTAMTGIAHIQIVTAGCVIFIVPLLIFYLVMQKKFIASIATSGIVG